jgi:hypothetical protein
LIGPVSFAGDLANVNRPRFRGGFFFSVLAGFLFVRRAGFFVFTLRLGFTASSNTVEDNEESIESDAVEDSFDPDRDRVLCSTMRLLGALFFPVDFLPLLLEGFGIAHV